MKHSIVAVSAAADTDVLANDVTAASGAAFTLAASATSDSLAHKIIITPSGSVTGNYTISGKDADGVARSETLATNTTSAVTSVKYYASDIVVTAPAGLGAETVDIGITADSVSARILPDTKADQFSPLGFGCTVSGSPTYTVQHSYGDDNWFAHSVVAAKTASADGSYSVPVAAVRLMFAAAGTVTFTGVQSGR